MRGITLIKANFHRLLEDVRNCKTCESELSAGVRPVIQIHPNAKILIAGQAPGRRVHNSGIPFDDNSGRRLREWMGVSSKVFYDANDIAILPMGFCFPGSAKSGDLPPRPECLPLWREKLLKQLPNLQLTIVLGAYAQSYHFPGSTNVTDSVKRWKDHWPTKIALPHPSPRNNIWLRRNPWFEEDVLPNLQNLIAAILNDSPPA